MNSPQLPSTINLVEVETQSSQIPELGGHTFTLQPELSESDGLTIYAKWCDHYDMPCDTPNACNLKPNGCVAREEYPAEGDPDPDEYGPGSNCRSARLAFKEVGLHSELFVELLRAWQVGAYALLERGCIHPPLSKDEIQDILSIINARKTPAEAMMELGTSLSRQTIFRTAYLSLMGIEELPGWIKNQSIHGAFGLVKGLQAVSDYPFSKEARQFLDANQDKGNLETAIYKRIYTLVSHWVFNPKM